MNITSETPVFLQTQGADGRWSLQRSDRGAEGLYDLLNAAHPAGPWTGMRVSVGDGVVVWSSEIDGDALFVDDEGELWGTADDARREAFHDKEAEDLYAAFVQARRMEVSLGVPLEEPRTHLLIEDCEIQRVPVVSEEAGEGLSASYRVTFQVRGTRFEAQMERERHGGKESFPVTVASANGVPLLESDCEMIAPVLWTAAIVGIGDVGWAPESSALAELRFRAPVSALAVIDRFAPKVRQTPGFGM